AQRDRVRASAKSRALSFLNMKIYSSFLKTSFMVQHSIKFGKQVLAKISRIMEATAVNFRGKETAPCILHVEKHKVLLGLRS
ncbi:MAG: hypothetical protein RR450_07130, partial [Oscillospiraceae bacterium]